ncbi:hypothetical protein GGR50DRAFT_694601 [Xylaria sp. CBS 124048]|nr:hypothetical protein GGR50DRAFT_694601 [Xylaria sp. CBS 124048]
MLPTLARRLAAANPSVTSKLGNATKKIAPRTCVDITYRPKKVWPPDFSKLSRQQQFRLEKRHKRRLQLATARPRWEKYVKLAQFVSIVFVLVYSVLFAEWRTEVAVLEEIRASFWNFFGVQYPAKRHERQ